jgi:energy-coupling factor transporter transmembrane protein EcfT
MDKFTIIMGAVFELAALFVIARLWRWRRLRLIPRILVSVIFLVPFVFAFYFLFFVFADWDVFSVVTFDKIPKKTDTGAN